MQDCGFVTRVDLDLDLDPDPALFVIDLQDANKKIIKKVFLYIYIILQDQKS
jgi:hypothetical protein